MEVLYLAYAVYGFTFAFISLAVQYELVNTFKYDASSLAFAWSSISAPWTLKPLYGYISDKSGRRICIMGLSAPYPSHFSSKYRSVFSNAD